jgi:hypothetical protein
VPKAKLIVGLSNWPPHDGLGREVHGTTFTAHGSLLLSRPTDGETRVWGMELTERNGILRKHERFVYEWAGRLRFPEQARIAY